MSWDERIKEAAYTSPAGNRFVFQYGNVSRETDKKTTVFTFPDKEGAFIQDLGRGGRRYPFVIFFSGEDYDLQANDFYTALEETGIGRLEHPVYGEKDVVPTGTIRQRDDLVTGANQAAFEVEFWETLIEVRLPTADTDLTSRIDQSLTEYQDDASKQFDESEVLISTSTENIDFKAKFETILTTAKDKLKLIAEAQSDIRSKFNSIFLNILNNIDFFAGNLTSLAYETIDFLRLPSRSFVDITSKINAYEDMILAIAVSIDETYDRRDANEYYIRKLFVQSGIVALYEATLYTNFTTKPEVIDTIDRVESLYFSSLFYVDALRDTFGLIDTGEGFQKQVDVASLSALRLVQLSFTLVQERIIITDKPYTIIDLAAQLFGDDPNDQVDNLINANNFNGDQILEIPKGTEVTYFI